MASTMMQSSLGHVKLHHHNLWQPPALQCSCPRRQQLPLPAAQSMNQMQLWIGAASFLSYPQGRPNGSTVRAAATTNKAELPPLSTLQYSEDEFVEIGRVLRAHGVTGKVRISISTDNPKARFGTPGKRIYAQPPPLEGLLARAQAAEQQGLLQLTVSSGQVKPLAGGEEAWIVGFKELTDRDQAEALQGWTLLLPVAAREKLRDPDEFWVQDLVGCRAFTKADSKYVGKVLDVISGTGTHDTLVLQLATNKDDIINSRVRTCMVPFVKMLCPLVDLSDKQLIIDPPEGLLDMFTYKKLGKKLSEDVKKEKLAALASSQPPMLSLRLQIQASEEPEANQQTQQQPDVSSQSQRRTRANVTRSKQKEEQLQEEEELEDEELTEGEDDIEEIDGEQEQVKPSSAVDRWRLRRKAGVSFAGRKRR